MNPFSSQCHNPIFIATELQWLIHWSARAMYLTYPYSSKGFVQKGCDSLVSCAVLSLTLAAYMGKGY